ncbi:glycerol-3-phosphate 1-O-acyltransferase PlsY [Gemmatimonadota bacterium]
MLFALGTLGSYLLGSVPTSYVVGRWIAGKDLRQLGSKNLGATNVYRVLGLKYAIPVAIVDVAKGVVPVALFAPHVGSAPWAAVTMGAAAIFGHVFSVFLKFRGGKGVATASGVVLALAPTALAVSLVVWVVVLTLTGYVSVASVLGALVFPVAVWFVMPEDMYMFGTALVLAAFIVFTHRTNIRRLALGMENRFGEGRRGTS